MSLPTDLTGLKLWQLAALSKQATTHEERERLLAAIAARIELIGGRMP